jgi:serine/threonine-protein kinase
MPVEQILKAADEVLDVLAVAHAKGITHRDIKPANLFLTNEGRLKVLDFGIARLADGGVDGSSTQTGVAMGTPSFMPPEQARGRKLEIDARTDVWAVGATILALLSGERPRRAETAAEELLLAMTAPMPPLLQCVPTVPSAIAAVVDRALAFEREARWPDARSMQMALRDCARPFPEAPHDSTGPRVDTAPVLIASPAVGPEPTTQLSTGGTLAGLRSAAPRGRRSVVTIFVASFVVAMAIAVPVVRLVVHRNAEPGAFGEAVPPATAGGVALPATPPASSPSATEGSGPASVTEVAAASASVIVPAVDSAPSTPPGPRPLPTHATARPPVTAQPAPAASAANPLDKRF